ncbi:ATP-binding cassette domain-containing protein [Tepidiforma flava]|uniref:ATP-binding cassette domain-containing protein n=1 Tax=Tepidiforma flava TaxID=3004094 RepID=A0ABY7MAA4_9CHLR|nr:ATP-binding cassette domain-containing protein [Tepidiforma flava]WBL37477.1 ATP-binding cassette domain-containing protein [Tepidiforma flava]
MEVRFEDVEVRKGGRTVLEVPGLTLGRAAVTALLGPNGSGKTTALRLMAGLERPARGRVLLDGEPAERAARKAAAYAFQRAVFLRGTVRANLDLALRLRGVPAAERARRIARAAEACGIGHLLERDALRLSGGEAQRANLARALALEAELVLLDEPLSGLDGPGRAALLADLPGMLAAARATVVLVTHDRDEALLLAQELVLLIGGRPAAHGPAGEVFRRPPTREAAAFLGYTLLGSEAIRPGAPPSARGAGVRARGRAGGRPRDAPCGGRANRWRPGAGGGPGWDAGTLAGQRSGGQRAGGGGGALPRRRAAGGVGWSRMCTQLVVDGEEIPTSPGSKVPVMLPFSERAPARIPLSKTAFARELHLWRMKGSFRARARRRRSRPRSRR